MRFPFYSRPEGRICRQPAPTQTPRVQSLQVAAQYRMARVGGDFFEFLQAGHSRLLFLLLDIAGRRDEAMHIAAAVQDTFRSLGEQLFAPRELNEADAVMQLALDINRTVIATAGGVRNAPGFIGCFNEQVGTVTYINAGHVPALLADGSAVSLLEANGLPLGLFSHSTHDAQVSVLAPGSVLLLVSRGLIEVRADGQEFGLERVEAALLKSRTGNADQLCKLLLDEVCDFAQDGRRLGLLRRTISLDCDTDSPSANDITAVVLMRSAAALAATGTA